MKATPRNSARMREVIFRLVEHGRISGVLMHYPDDVLLCVNEYIKETLRVMVTDEKENGCSEEGKIKNLEANTEVKEQPRDSSS